MISESAVNWAAVAVYAVALVASVGWLRTTSADRRRYCYPVVAVLGVAEVMAVLTATGIGVVPVNGTEFDVAARLDDHFAYAVLWAITARLAGVSGRTFVFVVALPVAQCLAFAVAMLTGGVVALAAVVFVVGGHVTLTYLFFGRVWKAAASVPAEQRLLHWKARNLLWFLTGMLIVFAVLSLGSVFDEFVIAVLNQYMSVLIRVGFAGFLFANIDAIATDEFGGGLLPSDLSGTTGGGEDATVGAD